MSIHDLRDDVCFRKSCINEWEGFLGRAVIMMAYCKREGDITGMLKAQWIISHGIMTDVDILHENYNEAMNSWRAECKRLGLNPGD